MKPIALIALASLSLGLPSFAQMPGGPPPDPCAALAKFLNKDAAFTATAKVVTAGKSARDNQTLGMLLAVSGDNMRNEIDLATMSGVRAGDLQGMKQMGMDKMVILKQADKKTVYLVYPNLKSYCDMPGARNSAPEGKLEKTEQGRDTVGTHACTKSKLVFTDKEGRKAEALVWEATDLKNFPVQYQTVDDGKTTTTTFSDIKMEKPAASVFELPGDYKKYDGMQQMIMGNMDRFTK